MRVRFNVISRVLATLLVALSVGVVSANAAPIFTTNEAAFLLANPGLALEDFENANLASGTDTSIASPLNSATNNAIFATVSVIPGFSLATTSGGVYVSRDFAGNTGANVSSNVFAADMNVTFGPAVTAIGIDLKQWNGQNGGWTVEVYDINDVLLGSFATNAGSFVGITSTDAIARMFLNKPNSGAVIDNLRFGAAAVPEPSMLLLFGLAGAAGLRQIRRRK
jgi:hypothetical protein